MVKLVNQKNYRLVILFGISEKVLCAYFNTLSSVYQHYCCISNIERRDCSIDEVIGTGAVNNIQFFSQPFCVKHGRKHRETIFVLYSVIIRYRVITFYITSAIYNTTLKEHSFSEGGFTRAAATKQRYVLDLISQIYLHDVSI